MPLAADKKPDGNKWRKEPILQTRGSKFIKFQEARIQVCTGAYGPHRVQYCLHSCEGLVL